MKVKMSPEVLAMVNDSFAKELAILDLSDAEPEDMYPVDL